MAPNGPIGPRQARVRGLRPLSIRLWAQHSPPLWQGIVIAVVLIVAETWLVYVLERVGPRMIFGVLYLLGVLVISFGWGIGLGVLTTVVSAAVYLEVHLRGSGLLPATPQNLLAVAVFVPVALLANVLGANARARAAEARSAARQVSELARRQAALRRVATLVARGVSPTEIFAAVADEVANALGVGNATLVRYLEVDVGEIVGAHDEGANRLPVGARLTLEGDNVAAMVQRTGATAKMDSHEYAAGPAATLIRDLGLVSGVGAPIVVDGRLWGAAVVGFSRPEPPPPETAEQLTEFAELVATAIANAEARGELIASRARIVAAGDEAMRRIERDLHDGAQQRLVALGMRIRSLQASLPQDSDLDDPIGAIGDALAEASEELRQISHGIHPAVLSRGGLGPALRALRRRAAVPVELNVDVERRLPESVEVATYYVVAEALTNAAKHAQASEVTVTVEADAEQLRLLVKDDGVGGAGLGGGSGLVGLKDRVEALGGHIDITSPDHHGTTLVAEIPCPAV
ncbi:histidine kinase,GAF domain-containing protein [Mycobacterium sp. JS623]|uniref:GAF domain-containing sensor histidine kinase n=1 Tax=Mycobacterium sp. JS623 TaxID=212767 RepID=UPI0002A55064|nr:GAF domain-containing protein [Mycobacterium sp. JS623]AGB23894.1 histidine kinase,GAF domain-containing protein [Mycobacterium sp. JS623]